MKVLSALSLAALVGVYARTPAPPEAAPTSRVISFTTNEGTWISLDVSPDGQTIVFELLGDIYMMPSSGGAARAILTGTAFQSQPRFSPDGRSLLYVSDGSGSDNVWIASADGSNPRPLSQIRRALVISPDWSHDGKAIFATVSETRGAAEIWRFDASSGRSERLIANQNGPASQLVSTPAPGGYGPDATPGGHSLLYASVTPSVARMYVRAQSRVVRYDLATREEVPLTLAVSVAMKPLVSPDGRWLVYGGQSEGVTGLRVRELATGEERWLRRRLQRNELESRASRDVLPNYAFTPDSRAVVIAYDGKIHRIAIEGRDDRVIPFQANVSLEIADRISFPQRVTDAPVRGRIVPHVALAADGRIAFSTLARVYVTDSDGQNPRRLTSADRPREFMPAWSPDGRWVAFVTWGAGGGDLWKVRADGGEAPIRLTTIPSLWVDPAWTPSGDSIVVIRGATSSSHAVIGVPADAELVIVPAAGGASRVIASALGARRPHFGADARRVYAMQGSGALVSISLDGGTRRTEATLAGTRGGFGASPGALRVSPDGKQLALLVDERLYRMPMPPLGTGTIPALDPRTAASGTIELGALAPAAFTWSTDGSAIAWVNGNRLAHLDAHSSGAAPQRISLAVEVPRARPSGTVVLRGGRVITMRGYEVIPRADIVVTDNRIIAIGARGATKIPTGARVIDVTGTTIVPGFVDVHAHLSQRHELVEPEAASLYANLAFGTTTLRDPQTAPDVFAYADLIDAGESVGPRVYSTGPGVGLGTHDFMSYEETLQFLTRYRDDFGTHLLKSYIVGNRQQRQWVVQACRELGIMPTTEGGADTKMDITHAIDGFSGNEHSVPTTPVYRDLVELFARSGITYTPTLLVTFGGALPIYVVQPREKAYRNPKMRHFAPGEQIYPQSAGPMLSHPEEDYNYREAAAGANAILSAGGRIALGGHGEMHGLQAHWEMALLAEGGMAPHDVLRVATISGAEALGLDAELGSLEKGKLADLVVLDRDPRVEIRNTQAIRYVMKNGVLYDDETLDELWPAKRKLPATWWGAQVRGDIPPGR